ncbi:AAA family ATPase [Bradyrhizobium ottawaense]|nr:AAA family ATPase [Bradyrhizobium ottawaense]GMP03137.1 AAA family ATPase [Bradyrhizobium ottawaense]GMP03278.1 AAA family ATPase [Bradyrhizobium ottawaense]GMP15334.1 AAA family ATPase [Bradyrhizobium ottawaense]
MRIKRVQIANWRSIKYIDFHPEDICILVGANNAGKTNVLSAINFILGERWPMPANLDDSDFYGRDRARNIHIRLCLEHPLVSEIDFDTSKSQYALNATDNHGRLVRPFTNAHREELAFAYVDAGRNYERQFSTSRWSIFGQALRHLHQTLKDSGEQLVKLREALNTAHDLLQTDQYRAFEKELKDAFAAQLRTARYDVSFEFRTLEETNLYRSLYPTLVERGVPRNPSEVGSGVRNVLVLALFQAFAKSFRGDAVLGIEEPELYLHPHAQRSLMKQFETIAAAGNQLFISTHSAHFLDVDRSDRIVRVERCEDEEEEVCTQVKTASSEDFLSARQNLHPQREMTVDSVRAFVRNVRTAEMTEAFFAHVVIIVEGNSEREAIPVFARSQGLDFDENGISIVSAGGKSAIDTLFQLYEVHELKNYTVFDNDSGNTSEKAANRTLCRLHGRKEEDEPAACVEEDYAILQGNWEAQSRAHVDVIQPGLYAELEAQARAALGITGDRNKPLVARFVAEALVQRGHVPQFVKDILEKVRKKLPPVPNPESRNG